MTVVGGSTDHLIVDEFGNTKPNAVLEVQTVGGVAVTDLTAPTGWTGLPFPPSQARADGNGYFQFIVPDATGPVQVRTAAHTVGTKTFAAGPWLTPSGQIVPGSAVEQALAARVLTADLPTVDLSGNTSLSNTFGRRDSGPVFNVKDFDAACDGVVLRDASITSGSAVLTCSTAAFVQQDVGKTIQVLGAGAAGGNLVTTILSRQSATQVTLATTATTAVVAGRTVTDGVTTAGYETITSATAAFTASDVGKLVTMTAGGVTTYRAEITAVTSATSAKVIPTPKKTATGATFVISGAEIAYGTDDTAAWRAAHAAADAQVGGGGVVMPAGVSIVAGQISVHGGANPGTGNFLTGKRGGVRIMGASSRASRIRLVTGDTLFYCSDTAQNKEAIDFRDIWLEGPSRGVVGSRAIFNDTGGEYNYFNLSITGFETGVQFYDTTFGHADGLHVEHCKTGVAFGWQSDQHNFRAYVRYCGLGYQFGTPDGTHTRDHNENGIVISGDYSYNTLGFQIYDNLANGILFDHAYAEGNVKEGEISDLATPGGKVTGIEFDGCWWDPQLGGGVRTGPAIEVFCWASLTFRNCSTPDNQYAVFLQGRNDIRANGMSLTWENNNIICTSGALSFAGRLYNPGRNVLIFNQGIIQAVPYDLGNVPSWEALNEVQGTGATNAVFGKWTRRISTTNAVLTDARVQDVSGVMRIEGVTEAFIAATSVGALPTAAAKYRACFAYVPGNGTTTADTTYVCLMSATGSYSWKPIVAG